MIERVAMAMCRRVEQELFEATGDHAWKMLGHSSLDSWVCAAWRNYEGQARAAIEAMLEPTAAMEEAGYRARDRHSPYTFEGTTYRAMVKEALNPAPSDTTPVHPPAA